MFEVLAKLWNMWGVSKTLKCLKKMFSLYCFFHIFNFPGSLSSAQQSTLTTARTVGFPATSASLCITSGPLLIITNGIARESLRFFCGRTCVPTNGEILVATLDGALNIDSKMVGPGNNLQGSVLDSAVVQRRPNRDFRIYREPPPRPLGGVAVLVPCPNHTSAQL